MLEIKKTEYALEDFAKHVGIKLILEPNLEAIDFICEMFLNSSHDFFE